MGPNEIQTLLRAAIEAEDYSEAARLRDMLAAHREDKSSAGPRPLSWEALGTVPWLVDRLGDLGLGIPTTTQCHAFEAVSALIDENFAAQKSFIKRPPVMGVLVTGEPGSGKTLAYAAPLLTALTESLSARQDLRGKREEDLEEQVDDFLESMKAEKGTEVSAPSAESELSASGDVARKKGPTLGKGTVRGETDTRSPLAVVIVSSRELGVQTALEFFKFVGGNTRREKVGQAGDRANPLRYKGPRDVRIAGVLTDAELAGGLASDVDVLVTTPDYFNALMELDTFDPSALRAMVVDEADLCLGKLSNEVVDTVWTSAGQRTFSFVTFLVGASLEGPLAAEAVKKNILPPDSSYVATEVSFERISSDKEAEVVGARALESLKLRLDSGLVHRALRAPSDAAMLRLTRMLQAELRRHEETKDVVDAANYSRPRVMVFFPDEDTARRALGLLRDSLWGEHKVCALLPKTGEQPVTIMERFKYNETTVMLATPSSIRGLDFPAVTHVYTLFLPVDLTEYLHLAGRVGRIGQVGSGQGNGGVVTSILEGDGEIERFDHLAKTLNFEYVQIDYDAEYAPKFFDDISDENLMEKKEDIRKYLEDLALLTGGESNIAPTFPDFVDTEEITDDDDDVADDATQ